MRNTIEIQGEQILANGKSVQILSGAMHYFRVHPDYWRDRVVKLKQCGLNTLETYLAWNFHEPREGRFDFSGAKDFARYIEIAQEEGLMVIVRPGPYICSEWDLGGLPAWLLAKPGLRLRCLNQPFLDAVDRYMERALALLKPLQFTAGGPVIAMQIENEYGSYGNDQAYLLHLKECFVKAGIDVPLFTSDGAGAHYLAGGALPGVLATVNFRNHPERNLAALDKFRPGTPKFVMELWDGGAHHWGKMYPEHPAAGVREDVAEILDHKFHMNLYMFHGGTNFGFMNGANYFDRYMPMLSTYDVDAPLSEEGDPTPKYHAIREEIQKRAPTTALAAPASLEKRAYGKIQLTESVTLADALPRLADPIQTAAPETMERYGQAYGFILYRTRLAEPGGQQLELEGLQDRAVIMFDNRVVHVAYRNDPSWNFAVSVPESGGTLDILVENMGRVNFGDKMERELKGVTGVRSSGQHLFGWEVYPLPLDNTDKLVFGPERPADVPAFHRGTFLVDKACDTFLKVPGGVKGVVFLNGVNLGRYWQIGPQKTLYVPAPLLRRGKNSVVVFELEGLGEFCVESVARRDFGPRALMQI